MGENSQPRFSENLDEFFSSGTVILFTCAATTDFPLLYVSKNSKKILGFDPSYLKDKEAGWSDQVHPDDKKHVLDQFGQVIKSGGSTVHEYRFKTESGEYIWLRDEIKLIENAENGEPLIYGSSIDITERKKAEIALKENKTEELKKEIGRRQIVEEKLQKQFSYEKALSKCSNLLLESNSEEALHESLKVLQKVSNADRVFLYKNKEINGELFLKPVIEVTAPDVSSAVENMDEEKISYSKIPWWYEKLSDLEFIQAHVDEVPEPDKSLLEAYQVKSTLTIPITTNDEWSGYIGFADTKKKRVWHKDEISLLKTVAGIIGAFEKRKAIEKSMIQQRNYTQTILDSLPSIYLLMDDKLQFIQWNSNAENFTEYSAEELKTKNAFDLIVPSEHEKLQEAIQRVRDNEGEGAELHLLTKSGKEIPYFWRGYFIELEGKQRFLCVGVDITLQKKTEQDLLNEKRFNEALLEGLPGIFYMFDKDGNYHRWNQNHLDELGYTAEEMEEVTPAIFFEEEEYKPVEQAIQEVFEEGESEIEANLLTKNGKKIPYYLTGKSFEMDGKSYLLGVGHNISEQVKDREKLRKSENLFRNLFLKAPAAIVMVDAENNVLDLNKSFEKMFGYSKEELQGKDVDEFIVPEEERVDIPRMPLKNYPAEKFHREAKRLTKDGDLIDVFIAAIPVYMDDEPLAGFGMYIDITEEKNYEKEISSSLKEKQVMLQEIHHRVKNNLAAVSGLLQLQMYESDDPEVQATLEESERRIQTMGLIHEKLYNSRNLDHISCDTYIGDLVETIRNTIGTDKDVTVETDIAEVELNIKQAVPFALLVNEVVTNSFKHAFKDQEKGTIAIKLQKKENCIHVRLSDDGVGLPDKFLHDDLDTLGMNLISNFAQQLDAEWELATDNGTYLEMTFEVSDTDQSSSNGMG